MLSFVRTLALAAFLAASPALAHTPQQPPHQSYKIGDLTLEKCLTAALVNIPE